MYPKTLYITVNSQEEEQAAIAAGCVSDDSPRLEYPKMVYLHPVDKTKEHSFLVVNSEEEKDVAIDKGYNLDPHIPAVPPEDGFEGTPVTHDEVAAEVEAPATEEQAAPEEHHEG